MPLRGSREALPVEGFRNTSVSNVFGRQLVGLVQSSLWPTPFIAGLISRRGQGPSTSSMNRMDWSTEVIGMWVRTGRWKALDDIDPD